MKKETDLQTLPLLKIKLIRSMYIPRSEPHVMFVREVDFRTLETGSGREAREIMDPVSEEA